MIVIYLANKLTFGGLYYGALKELKQKKNKIDPGDVP